MSDLELIKKVIEFIEKDSDNKNKLLEFISSEEDIFIDTNKSIDKTIEEERDGNVIKIHKIISYKEDSLGHNYVLETSKGKVRIGDYVRDHNPNITLLSCDIGSKEYCNINKLVMSYTGNREEVLKSMVEDCKNIYNLNFKF